MSRAVPIVCPRCAKPALLEVFTFVGAELPIVTCEWCGPKDGLEIQPRSKLAEQDVARARAAALEEAS